MKCTDNNKIRLAALAAASMLLFCGCGTKTYELDHPYDVYGTTVNYIKNQPEEENQGEVRQNGLPYFAERLCVAENESAGPQIPQAEKAQAAGVFHLQEQTVTYARNIYQKMYPASTTKILTAYTALKHAQLTDIITVSAQAADQAGDSSVCGLHEGDRLTLEELLYGLLLESGNDAAVAIAEHVSGSSQAFASLMNEEAAALGATHSHFTNPHGLHEDDHYTCVYDLYLMLNAALKYEKFQSVIRTETYTASYTDAAGNEVSQEWTTTDKFLNGEAQVPEGITVIGGKTGTTNAAGYCLALYSNNAAGEPVISIVMKAESSEDLYALMGELLQR